MNTNVEEVIWLTRATIEAWMTFAWKRAKKVNIKNYAESPLHYNTSNYLANILLLIGLPLGFPRAGFIFYLPFLPISHPPPLFVCSYVKVLTIIPQRILVTALLLNSEFSLKQNPFNYKEFCSHEIKSIISSDLVIRWQI